MCEKLNNIILILTLNVSGIKAGFIIFTVILITKEICSINEKRPHIVFILADDMVSTRGLKNMF